MCWQELCPLLSSRNRILLLLNELSKAKDQSSQAPRWLMEGIAGGSLSSLSPGLCPKAPFGALLWCLRLVLICEDTLCLWRWVTHLPGVSWDCAVPSVLIMEVPPSSWSDKIQPWISLIGGSQKVFQILARDNLHLWILYRYFTLPIRDLN